MSNPKMPIPHYISQEAQDFLKPAITTKEHDPAPQSTEEWLAFVEASNANYAPFVEAITTSTDVSIEKTTIAGVTVRIITPKTLPENKKDKILVNLHGGGYVMLGGDQSIMEAVGMALAGQFKVISVDYRMPPLHPFPAAVDDGLAVYQSLLAEYGAENIALFGASAGGGLSAAVTLQARDQGLPMPACLALNTPWSDLNKIGDSYFSNHGVDPVLSSYDGWLGHMADIYAGEVGFDHPLVSPVYADYSAGLPPSILISGTRDLLLSCTVRLHRRLREANIEAELHVFEAMWHGFMAMPEGQQANQETIHFFEKHFKL